MATPIEVELRGPLTAETYAAVKKYLAQHGISKGVKQRILIDYSTFLPGQESATRTRDIRLRVTNGIPEIIIKLGAWGGADARKEISLCTNPGTFDTLVQIFGAMGFTKGMLCQRTTYVYEYQGIEFALVEIPGHSYYFEAEQMVNEGTNKQKIMQKIIQVCNELQLTVFTNEKFFAYVQQLNTEANEVFDFYNYQDNDFKNRFHV